MWRLTNGSDHGSWGRLNGVASPALTFLLLSEKSMRKSGCVAIPFTDSSLLFSFLSIPVHFF